MQIVSFFISLSLAIIWVSWPGMFKIDLLLQLLTAVVIHELGHILMIYALRLQVKKIRLEPTGFRIEYCGFSSIIKELLIAAAGSSFGLIFYLISKGVFGKTEFCAELSLLYSLFNLLPAYPLDGGRIISLLLLKYFEPEASERLCNLISFVISLCVVLLGLLWFLEGEGASMFAAGIWLLLMQNGN